MREMSEKRRMMDLRITWKIQYGMFIISSEYDGKKNGQIANTFFQVTADPPRFGVSINKLNFTHDLIDKKQAFSVSILNEDAPMTFMGKFGFKSGRDIDKFEDTDYLEGKTGVPIVRDYTLGYIECEVIDKIDAGTHTLFIGEMLEGEIWDEGANPMTYAFYHLVKNGKTPKTATHFIPDTKETVKKASQKTEAKMDKYVCTVCGYVYDPEVGDPDGGIEPGTSFEDIPDDWTCPVCGVGKEDFEKE